MVSYILRTRLRHIVIQIRSQSLMGKALLILRMGRISSKIKLLSPWSIQPLPCSFSFTYPSWNICFWSCDCSILCIGLAVVMVLQSHFLSVCPIVSVLSVREASPFAMFSRLYNGSGSDSYSCSSRMSSIVECRRCHGSRDMPSFTSTLV